ARAAFLPRDHAAWWTRIQVPLHLDALLGGKRAVRVLREQIANAATGGLHRRPPAASAATGAGAASFSYSSRRPREMRDITVPIGTLNISAISAYVNSSTSRSQTASRNASG